MDGGEREDALKLASNTTLNAYMDAKPAKARLASAARIRAASKRVIISNKQRLMTAHMQDPATASEHPYSL